MRLRVRTWKDILVDKLLTLTEGKVSQGVKDYSVLRLSLRVLSLLQLL